MGKIYEDIVDSELQEKKEAIDMFSTVTSSFIGRPDIRYRDSEINRITGIMDKKEYRSVLLVGDKGCGKISIIEGYINKLQEEYRSDVVFTVDYDDLCDNVNSPSDFGKIIESIITIAHENENVILNINNIGHLLNHNIYGNGGFSFLNRIVGAIYDLNIRVIATTTTDEFNDIDDDFHHLLDYFTVIKVTELTKDETVDIINDNISNYEEDFNLKLPVKMSKLVCDNADKYIKDRPFPEKGEWLFDEVCANLVIKKSSDKKLKNMMIKSNQLKLELAEQLEGNDYLKCEEINKQIESLEKKIEKYNKNKTTLEITESDVLEVIGDIVGVKMSKLDKNQTTYLQHMGSELKESVIGQDETVDKIVKNIIRNKLGLRKSSHSMGNFIFIGSTGVGKTHLAKQIARYLYGSEENLLRFDMSEYQSEIDVSKLLGSAPGYVGYKESGLLVKRLAKYPESVVLFDEIEKAHPKIYDVLLQLLDEGFVTGSDGNKVDATKSLIIFTSNVGVRAAKEFGSPIGYSNNTDEIKGKQKEEIIRKALNKRFSPEFLNRLDGICYFNNLDRNTLKFILHKEMKDMNENIQNICGKTIELTKNVEKWILDKVEEEENGARPIIRHLQQNIEEELSTMIIEDNEVMKSNKKTLKAYINNNKITLK
ncbi:MAG: AAA family ATPase [Lachnospiraceae bacterium]|nr:AAA family ATPase [Lachnospiraceae bacterium]